MEIKISKSYLSLLFMFNLVWFFLYIITYFNFFEFYPISTYSYLIIFSGICSINFGVFYSKFIKLKKRNLEFDLKKIKLLKIINNTFLMVNLYYCLKVLKLLKKYSYAAIRVFQYPIHESQDILYGSKYLRMIYHTLASPLAYFFIFFSMYIYFNKKNLKLNKIQIYVGILNFLLVNFITAGRITIVMSIVFIILYHVQFFKSIKLKIPKKIIIFGILIVIISSFYRSWNKKSFSYLETLVVYYTGSFVAFSNYLEKNNDLISYGRIFFNMIDFPISLSLKLLGFDILPASEQMLSINHKFIKISNNISFNAFYTMFQAFYIDLREIGVVIFSFLTGFFYGSIYRAFKDSSWGKFLIVYLQTLMIHGSLNNQLLYTQTVITIIMLLFFSKKKTITNFHKKIK